MLVRNFARSERFDCISWGSAHVRLLNGAEMEERVINADNTIPNCVSQLGTVRQVTNRMDITCGSLAAPKKAASLGGLISVYATHLFLINRE
jgi:hypothetical protein